MGYKVEVHPDVTWFVKHRCSRQEQRLFYEKLHRLRSQALRNSEVLADPQLSRYALRCFRFGMNLAVFKFDPGRNQIWILKCQRLKPEHRPGKGKEGASGAQ